MNCIAPSAPIRRVGISTLAFLFLPLAAVLGAEAETNRLDGATYYGAVPVTCKLAYYAVFHYERDIRDRDIQLLVADPPRTNIATMEVDGVVMEVFTPKELAGKTLCICLDFAPRQVAEVHFKRGVVYRGYCYPKDVGRLMFKAEGLFEPVAEPGGAANRSRPVGTETNRTSAAAGSGG